MIRPCTALIHEGEDGDLFWLIGLNDLLYYFPLKKKDGILNPVQSIQYHALDNFFNGNDY
jgi:hypothetical protein